MLEAPVFVYIFATFVYKFELYKYKKIVLYCQHNPSRICFINLVTIVTIIHFL